MPLVGQLIFIREKLFKYLLLFIEEIVLKLEVPSGLEDKVGSAAERLLSEFLEEIRYSVARDILEGSKLTSEQAKELGKEVNREVAKRHL